MKEFKTKRKIEFVDTDMEGIVHFARYLVYMETAEHEFLEALGVSVAMEHEGQRIGWPRVSVSCDYKAPARFGDTLDIHMRVLTKGASSMTYAFDFLNDGQEVATGRVTSVCCAIDDGKLRPIKIPAIIADQIEVSPA
ncbi:MAG: thioesterase family protein [Acidobacteriota bacterium]|nr:thioesterase family protein [Acidobacteriota bacterium]